MTNKERFIDYAKKHNIAETEEILDRRLAIIPEMSRKVVETRWGLNEGTYCLKFDSLDKLLGINDSKKVYDKAMNDLEQAKYAELIADREEIRNWDMTCGLGLLAANCCIFNDNIIKEGRNLSSVDVPDTIGPDKIRGLDVQVALEKLYAREKKVMILRFGLDGNGARTLQEVADFMGCTRERIRLIENKAIRKLGSSKLFSIFYIPFKEEGIAAGPEEASEILKKGLDELGFTIRTYNCLKRANINTVEDILAKLENVVKEKKLLIKSAEEIIQFLETEQMANTDCKDAKQILEEYIRERK